MVGNRNMIKVLTPQHFLASSYSYISKQIKETILQSSFCIFGSLELKN